MRNPVVYDKAKYHLGSVELECLDEVQAEVHTAFFLGWLIDNHHVSDEFADDIGDLLKKYRDRQVMATDVYEVWDCCLIDNMLDSTGNAFARYYFDFDRGRYMSDYCELLVRDLPSEFHVANSWENYEIIRNRINERFNAWQASGRPSKRPWWQFW